MKTQELSARSIISSLMIITLILISIPTKTQSRSLLQTNCFGSSCDSGDPGLCQTCIDMGGTCTYTDTTVSCNIGGTYHIGLSWKWYGTPLDVIVLGPLGVTLVARYILCPLLLVVFLVYKCRQKRKSQEERIELVPRQ